MKVANIQHLATPVRAQLAQPLSVVDLAGALHPTSAVGGEPWARAEPLVRELERMDRGWYAAPVGWMDAFEDGEFCVALRCGLLAGRVAHCFAGGGRGGGVAAGRRAGGNRGEAHGRAARADGFVALSPTPGVVGWGLTYAGGQSCCSAQVVSARTRIGVFLTAVLALLLSAAAADAAFPGANGKIAYTRGEDVYPYPFAVHVMNGDGSGDVSLGSGRDPAWSPDGTKIAFVDLGGLWIMNADGSARQSVSASDSSGHVRRIRRGRRVAHRSPSRARADYRSSDDLWVPPRNHQRRRHGAHHSSSSRIRTRSRQIGRPTARRSRSRAASTQTPKFLTSTPSIPTAPALRRVAGAPATPADDADVQDPRSSCSTSTARSTSRSADCTGNRTQRGPSRIADNAERARPGWLQAPRPIRASRLGAERSAAAPRLPTRPRRRRAASARPRPVDAIVPGSV